MMELLVGSKVIVRSNDFTEGYVIGTFVEMYGKAGGRKGVPLVKNQDGKEFLAFGITVVCSEITQSVLDRLDPKQQWQWLSEILLWDRELQHQSSPTT